MDEDIDFRDFSGVCRLFPLPGLVMFPHAVLPLHIFEPRYRQMTEDALSGDRMIAIVQVRPKADWNGPDEPAIESVACLGKILQCDRLPDGRFNFLLQGRKRVRILRELDRPTLYRQAEVEILEDLEPLLTPEKPELIALYRGVLSRASADIDQEFDAMLDRDPPLGVITDLVAQSLGLPASLKQSLLEDRRVERRAEHLINILRQVSRRLDEANQDQTSAFPPPFSEN